MQLTNDQYKAVARLESQNTQDWRTFKDILRSARESTRDEIETLVDLPSIHRAQGRSLVLADLIDSIEDSREVAMKMQERDR